MHAVVRIDLQFVRAGIGLDELVDAGRAVARLGAAYFARFTLTGTLASLSVRWAGRSSLWSVLLMDTLESLSKVSLPPRSAIASCNRVLELLASSYLNGDVIHRFRKMVSAIWKNRSEERPLSYGLVMARPEPPWQAARTAALALEASGSTKCSSQRSEPMSGTACSPGFPSR